jgi:hypothetical protein
VITNDDRGIVWFVGGLQCPVVCERKRDVQCYSLRDTRAQNRIRTADDLLLITR